MLTASFYSTSKRTNSTAQPAGTADFSVVLAQPTSIERPTLILNTSANMAQYNGFLLLGRYYWITETISVHNGQWEISGACDLLATYKSGILGSVQYVVYSSSRYDEKIPDPRLTIIQEPNSITEIDVNVFGSYAYRFVLTAVGADGAVRSYLLTGSQVRDLTTSINNWIASTAPDVAVATQGEQGIIDSLVGLCNSLSKSLRQLFSFGSATDCIKDCFLIPWNVPVEYDIDPNNGNDIAYEVQLGNFSTGVFAGVIPDYTPTGQGVNATITLADDFTDYSPYTRISAFIPFVGLVQIPNEPVINGNGVIRFEWHFSPNTGEMVLEVSSGGVTIATYGSTIKAAKMIGRVSSDPIRLIGSTARAFMEPTIAGAAGAVDALFNQRADTAGSIGSLTSTSFGPNVKVFVEKHLPLDWGQALETLQGRPLHQVATLSTLTGYVETQGAHLSLNALSSETEAIESMLNTGIYIE